MAENSHAHITSKDASQMLMKLLREAECRGAESMRDRAEHMARTYFIDAGSGEIASRERVAGRMIASGICALPLREITQDACPVCIAVKKE